MTTNIDRAVFDAQKAIDAGSEKTAAITDAATAYDVDRDTVADYFVTRLLPHERQALRNK